MALTNAGNRLEVLDEFLLKALMMRLEGFIEESSERCDVRWFQGALL